MPSPLYIAIKEENHFLATGIKHVLLQHFSPRPIEITVNNDAHDQQCDIMIISVKYISCASMLNEPQRKLIVLVPCENSRVKLHSEHAIYCHRQPVESLQELVDPEFKCEQGVRRNAPRKNLKQQRPPRLTERQQQVVELLAQGVGITQIAQMLCISNKSVSYLKRAIMAKMKLQNLAELHSWMQR